MSLARRFRRSAGVVWLLAACAAGLAQPARDAEPPQLAQAAQHARPAVPAPRLFDVSWSDRTDFAADLAPSFVPPGTSLETAPVYHLDLDVETPTRVRARFEARIVNDAREPWTELWFHLHPNVLGGRLEPADVRVDGHPAPSSPADDDALLRIGLDGPLEPGAAAVVSMDYVLSVPTTAQRNYGLLSSRDGVISLAHPYPILAVHRDGRGWDLDPRPPYGDLVFARAAYFRARVEAPDDYLLTASGAEVEGPADEGRRAWRIAAGPVRDLYLSLGPYATESRTAAATVVRTHFPDELADGARVAVDVAADALRVFAATWGPYPYRELDIVPLRMRGALGVEFPGIIALARSIYGPGDPDLEWVVVHEVAHQWFYGIVGNDQVSDPWLDEALAQHAVAVYAAEVYGPEAAQRVLAGFDRRWSSEGRRDVPIGLPVAAYDSGEYGAIVYGRGPLVIDEIARRMGSDAFRRFLQGWVAAFRWRIAEPQDFFAMAEAACHCDLGEIFADAVQGSGMSTFQ